MRIPLFGIAAVVFLSSTSPSFAVTYRALSSFPQQTRDIYIAGLGEGVFWSNAAAQSHGDPGMYCPPLKLGITGNQYVKLLDDYVADKTHYRSDFSPPDSEVGLLMILALTDAFPCTNGQGN